MERVAEDTGDHDHLLEPGDAVDYLARHHLVIPREAPSAVQLRRLAEIREMIRGLLGPARPAWSAAALAILRATRFVADADANIRAEGLGWDGLIGDLMLPLIELVDQRENLRLCGNPHCRLIFLDSSKNHSRRWCDTAGCGNRDRVARYRRAASN